MPDLVLYHATPAGNLPAILATGLDPALSRSSQGAVYLAADPGDTLNYVSMRSDEHDAFVIFAVTLSEEEAHLLGPDDYELRDLLEDMDEDELAEKGLDPDTEWSDLDWRTSLALCGQVAYAGHVPPASLRVHGTVDARIVPLRIEDRPAASPAP